MLKRLKFSVKESDFLFRAAVFFAHFSEFTGLCFNFLDLSDLVFPGVEVELPEMQVQCSVQILYILKHGRLILKSDHLCEIPVL
jgi:hypothetical protein